MKIYNLLPKNGILIDFKPADKTDALTQMTTFMASLYELHASDMIVQKVLERESEMSTGIGFGIAIPHARIEGLDRVYLTAARVTGGLEFDALDGAPVHLLFLLLSSKNTVSDHTTVLTTLSKIMAHEEVRQKCLQAQDAQTFLDVLINGEDSYAT